MQKQTITILSAGLILTTVFSAPVFAAESSTNATDELWVAPTVVYGGALSESERNQVATKLGADRGKVTELETEGTDVDKYLGTNGVSTSSLISCVEVTKERKVHGVQVNIVEPKNITRVTDTQYANAAITAGVSDVQINVIALTPATGESALTGVYKALEGNGVKVDTERSQVAQDELETTNDIAQKYSNQEDFNTHNLDQALIDIKTNLADLKHDQGSKATAQQVQEIVEASLEKYGLSDVLSQDDIDRLIQFAGKYQNSSAIDSKEVVEQLKQLSNGIKDFVDTGKVQGWLDKFVEWFKGLFGWFSDSLQQQE